MSGLERFQAEMEAEREEAYQVGLAAGGAWAAKDAAPEELRGLAEYRGAVADDFGTLGHLIIEVDMPGDFDHAIEILRNTGMMTPAAAALGEDSAARRFFGEHARDAGWLAGWCDGALEAWDLANKGEGGSK